MADNEEKPRTSFRWVVLGTCIGIVLTVIGAQAMKYTDTRPFCASCHVMSEAALTMTQAAHANMTCNDCHAPANALSRYPFKLKEAVHDVLGNMQGKAPAQEASTETKDVIKANCIRCHIVTNRDIDIMAVKPYCTDCHSGVAHTRKTPISTRMVADE